VLNHTIDVTEMPEPDFGKFNGNEIVSGHDPRVKKAAVLL
jgi:hypothetical protein